jgi:hypothetical protein
MTVVGLAVGTAEETVGEFFGSPFVTKPLR